MPYYGSLTNPSNEILGEISKIYDLGLDYVEVGIEGPEANPLIIEKKRNEIRSLIQKFKQKPTAHWIDLCSDYEYVRHASIVEAMREIKTARKIGIDLINFHANLNGMFYRERRKILLDNMIRSLREIVRYAHKYKMQVMLENVPFSHGIHNIDEF
jgi:sugar phosphate isomerase/epimerase